MTNLTLYPHQIGEVALEESDIDPEEVYNDAGGITRAQLSAIAALPVSANIVKKNVYKTIQRLSASANIKNINFAANITNTITGTISSLVMDTLEEETTKKQRGEQLVTWLPSSADEQDPFHALNYGKTMTLQQALDKGLGRRFNCQCGMEFVNPPKQIAAPVGNLIDLVD